MKKGTGAKPSFNAHSDHIIRTTGLLLPVALFVYGLLLQAGIVNTGHYMSVPVFYVTSMLLLILGAYQYLRPISSRADIIFRMAAYHALAIIYILFVSGLSMAFTCCWIVLFLTAYNYLGRDGLNLSIFGLFAATLGDALLNMGDVEYMVRAVLFFVATLVVGYVATTLTADRDVDRQELDRSQAEEELQRDRVLTIVNNLADAVLSTDKDGIIQLYNAASLNLLDTNSELTGKSIDDVIHLIDKDTKRFKLTKGFRTARSVEVREDLSATISSETIHLSVVYSPIRSTNSEAELSVDGYVVILRDITKQKSLEEERDEFISVVSHELRTPITIAEGSLSNLQLMMNRSDIPEATRTQNVTMAHEQVLFLARMVNDLSTLSRAERGVADTPEEIDVTQIAHDLYNEYAPQAEAKKLKFNLDLDPKVGTVSASRLYLKELIQNFVTNAIKYTKEGSVDVTIKKVDDQITFAVKDSGIGISKSDQAHVFDKFWRSEDYRTRETGGTGLGLYVATKLAKKLGTRIELNSRLNHGSTFSITLPASKSSTK